MRFWRELFSAIGLLTLGIISLSFIWPAFGQGVLTVIEPLGGFFQSLHWNGPVLSVSASTVAGALSLLTRFFFWRRWVGRAWRFLWRVILTLCGLVLLLAGGWMVAQTSSAPAWGLPALLTLGVLFVGVVVRPR